MASQFDKTFKALLAMESVCNKASRHSNTLEDKLRFQKMARQYGEFLRQHRLNFHEAEDAETTAASVEHCDKCGSEL